MPYYIIELHSNVIKTMMNENGEYVLDGVTEGNHELFVKDYNENVVGSIKMNIVYDGETNLDNGAILYGKDDNKVELNIKLTDGSVIFEQKNKNDIKNYIVIGGLLFILFILSLILKSGNKKTYLR